MSQATTIKAQAKFPLRKVSKEYFRVSVEMALKILKDSAIPARIIFDGSLNTNVYVALERGAEFVLVRVSLVMANQTIKSFEMSLDFFVTMLRGECRSDYHPDGIAAPFDQVIESFLRGDPNMYRNDLAHNRLIEALEWLGFELGGLEG